MNQGIPDGQPVVLSHREWVILQQAVLVLHNSIRQMEQQRRGEGSSLTLWEESDGPLPTAEEFSKLHKRVLTMPRDGTPGSPKMVACPKCQDRPGYDGLGRTCKGCNGKTVVQQGTW